MAKPRKPGLDGLSDCTERDGIACAFAVAYVAGASDGKSRPEPAEAVKIGYQYADAMLGEMRQAAPDA